MIMIVDDHNNIRTVLSRLLSYAGHETTCASGGAEALAMLEEHRPTLVVLDVNMPEIDGLTVLRTMKRSDQWKNVRVLMYSADTRPDVANEAKQLGAVGFIVKGSNGESLITQICEFASADD